MRKLVLAALGAAAGLSAVAGVARVKTPPVVDGRLRLEVVSACAGRFEISASSGDKPLEVNLRKGKNVVGLPCRGWRLWRGCGLTRMDTNVPLVPFFGQPIDCRAKIL